MSNVEVVVKIKVIVIWARSDLNEIRTAVCDDYGSYPTLLVPTSSGSLWFEDKDVLEFRKWLDRHNLEGGIIEREIDIASEEFDV